MKLGRRGKGVELFLSTPSARRATGGLMRSDGTEELFLSTPSARRATRHRERNQCDGSYFYPRPPRGGRHINVSEWAAKYHFYPRPPRGGRQQGWHHDHHGQQISIHALREEGDRRYDMADIAASGFLSTPSARRATAGRKSTAASSLYFYPRPPRGGRPLGYMSLAGWDVFLSTPSARRATSSMMVGMPPSMHFYPRPPRGGRQGSSDGQKVHPRISIHALREEGDQPFSGLSGAQADFYPRPPRGGRLQ